MPHPADQAESKGQFGILRAALSASCPRCGARTLFAGPATFAPRCRACGQDFASHELQGRQLYPVVLPVTVLLILVALRLDDVVRFPVWVLALVWPLFAASVVTLALRVAKAARLVRRLRAAGEA